MDDHKKDDPLDIEISDDDVYGAMREIEGYLDITPSDLREVYRLAFRHAVERIRRSVSAADIMTKIVFSVRTHTPLQDVARMMAEKQISGLPVLDDAGNVAGVISEKDFLSRMGAKDRRHVMGIIAACLEGKGCMAMPVRAKKAADIMAAPAITVRETTTAFEIMTLFSTHNINRVPIVDGSGKLMGIVSRADVIRAPLIRAPR
jgi:CBS-domain-containing membrane protein